MTDELPQAVKDLVDRAEIHDVLMRYCRGVDRCDLELVASAFHADALDDHGAAGPAPVSALLGRLEAGRETSSAMMHFVGNEYVELEGDVAFSETYFISCSMIERDGQPHSRFRGGRYLDRFERREGMWKIAARALVDEWSRLDRVEASGASSPGHRGRRSDEDLVYRLRTLGQWKLTEPRAIDTFTQQ